MNSRVAVVLAVVLVGAVAGPARGQGVEWFVDLAGPLGAPSGTYAVDYTPTLVFGTATGGGAAQTLSVDPAWRPALEAGVNWLVAPHGGLQVFVSRRSGPVGGANGSFALSLDFLSRPPPDYVERANHVESTIAWPDTTGTRTTWRVGLNALGRVPAGPVEVTVTGGLLVTRTSGEFGPAGYFEYRLGGHSTIFYNDVPARMGLVEAWDAGGNAAVTLAFPAGRRVALLAGLRVSGPSPVPRAAVVAYEDPDRVIFDVPLDTLDAALGGGELRFDRSWQSEFTVGLRVR
ncbi:MAG: hypothetical protein AB7H88_14125 [Vicinamibacterales bacterium]